jgi:hypothetical protein
MTIEHVVFIPGVLLVGLAIGFVLGVRGARDEAKKQQNRRRQ